MIIYYSLPRSYDEEEADTDRRLPASFGVKRLKKFDRYILKMLAQRTRRRKTTSFNIVVVCDGASCGRCSVCSTGRLFSSSLFCLLSFFFSLFFSFSMYGSCLNKKNLPAMSRPQKKPEEKRISRERERENEEKCGTVSVTIFSFFPEIG